MLFRSVKRTSEYQVQYCCVKRDYTEVLEVQAPLECRDEPVADERRVREAYYKAVSMPMPKQKVKPGMYDIPLI